MANDMIEFLEGFHLDDAEALAQELRQRIARGDFVTWRSKVQASHALRIAERAANVASGRTALGAAIRQAEAAERSSLLSAIAIGISLVSLAVSAAALFKL